MPWTVLYTASAVKQLRKLDRVSRERVRNACVELAKEPERGKPLQLTLKGLRSWRTGDFRIVYRVVDQRLEILVIALGHRREIYTVVERLLRGR